MASRIINKPVLYNIDTFDIKSGFEVEIKIDYLVSYKWRKGYISGFLALICSSDGEEALNFNIGLDGFKIENNDTEGKLYVPFEKIKDLHNGNQYSLQVAIKDTENNLSYYSEKIDFITSSIPTFNLIGVEEDEEVKSSNRKISVQYVNKDAMDIGSDSSVLDDLISFHVELYDENNILVDTSEEIIASETIYYTIQNLDNDSTYYVKAIGKTKYNRRMETKKIKFYTSYYSKINTPVVSLKNNILKGTISVNTLFSNINHETLNNNYHYNNGTVSIDSNNYVRYGEGLNLSDDFNIFVKIKSVNSNPLMSLNDGNIDVYFSSISDKPYCVLSIYGQNMLFKKVPVTISDNGDVTFNDDTSYIIINIKRIRNMYSFNIVTDGNIE